MSGVIANISPSQRENLSNLGEISAIVSRATGLKSATAAFSEYVARNGLKLLLLSTRNISLVHPPATIYSNIPPSLMRLCESVVERDGCPLIQKAMQTVEPCEAMSSEFTSSGDFSVKRYLGELKKLGHREIGVIPAQIGREIYVFVVGLGQLLFRGDIRYILTRCVELFVCSVSSKFPNLEFSNARDDGITKASQMTSMLSPLEREYLLLVSSGRSCSEISSQLGLSEHAILHIERMACSKLDAASLPHAVYIALRDGIMTH